MFVYIKGHHIGTVPGLREFAAEYASDKAFGRDGYLTDKGLIPLPDAERRAVRESVAGARALTM
jgi:phosphate transport system substrate-binding protein